MTDPVEAFEKLEMLKVKVHAVEVKPSEMLCLSLHGFAPPPTDATLAKRELRFLQIADFRIDMSWWRPCEVRSWHAFERSDYLDEFAARSFPISHKIRRERLRHYRLVFNVGQIDVLAESFACDVTWEV